MTVTKGRALGPCLLLS